MKRYRAHIGIIVILVMLLSGCISLSYITGGTFGSSYAAATAGGSERAAADKTANRNDAAAAKSAESGSSDVSWRELTAEISEDLLYEETADGVYNLYTPDSFASFWTSLMGRDAAVSDNSGIDRAAPVSVSVSGNLPEDVTAKATYTELGDDETYAEKALYALSITLLDGSGNVYIPDEPVTITISGESIKAAADGAEPLLVYAYKENAERAAEYSAKYSSDIYAADVTVYRDGSGSDDDLAYELYDAQKNYSGGQDAVRYSEYSDGLGVGENGTIEFMYSFSGDSGTGTAASVNTDDAAHFVVSAQMSEEEKSRYAGRISGKSGSNTSSGKAYTKTIIAGNDKNYEISVTYDETSGLPEDAELNVRELWGLRKWKYSRLTKKAIDTENLEYVRLFDITVKGSDGRKYQPDENVEVTISMTGDDESTNEYQVVHFDKKNNAEILETETDDNTITFETDGFSVYAVAGYTVDFHWEEYTYSIAGEDSVLLSELLNSLAEGSGNQNRESSTESGMSGDSTSNEELAALADDMSQIGSVEFSDPKLLKVEKQADADWMLTSLAPFDTEETLTIRLTDGEEITVTVTDEQTTEDSNTANYKVVWSDNNNTTKYYETLSDVASAVNTAGTAYNYEVTVYVIGDDAIINETSAVTFSKNYALTIDGQGNTITYTATGTTPLITRNQTTDFAIRNLTFTGASAYIKKNTSSAFTMYGVTMQGKSGSGSLVDLDGTGTNRFTKCTLDGGSISGALITDDSTGMLTLSNCTITGNEATNQLINKTGNGGITISGGTITASTGSAAGSLVKKTATGAGNISLVRVTLAGAASSSALVSDNGSGTLSISNCSIAGNEITGNLIEKTSNGAVNITGGTIVGSTVESTGSLMTKTVTGTAAVTLKNVILTGGISSGSLIKDSGTGTLTVSGCTVVSNNSTGNLIEKAGNGAIDISESTLTGSSASATGSLMAKTATGAGNITITDTTLNGGQNTDVLVSDVGTGALTMSGCTVNGPTVASSSAVLLKSSTGAVSISDSDFVRNNTTAALIKDISSGAMTINNVTFDGSNTDASEAMLVTSSGALSLSGITAQNHTSTRSDVYALDASKASSANVSGSMSVYGNTSASNAANFYISSKMLSVTGSMSGVMGISQTSTVISGTQFGTASNTGYSGMDTFVSDSNSSLVGTYNTSGSGTAQKYIIWGSAADPEADDDNPVCQLIVGSKVIKKYASLQNALDAAPNGSRVEMLCDVELTAEIDIDAGKTVTLTTADSYEGSSSVATISRASSLGTDKRMFNVSNASSSLTVKNLIIDGGNVGVTVYGAIFAVTNGKLTLDSGAVLQNGIAAYTNDHGEGGGIYMNGTDAYVTLKDGCVIQNCKAYRNTFYAGGGVCIISDENFHMEGGTIQNCEAPNGSGGGIGVNHHDVAYISGGLITNCTAKNRGGAIEIHGAVDMSGGTITACSSGSGGAINFYNGSSDSETADEGRIFLSGNPVIYNNLNTSGEQHNVDIYNHYSACVGESPNNIWVKDYDGLASDAHIGVRAGAGSAEDSKVFGRYTSGVDLTHVSLFTNDVDETLIGADGGSNNLVWAKGIRIQAKMYTKADADDGNIETMWDISDATGVYNFDYEGIATGSTASRTVTESIATIESSYRSSQGYAPMVDANPSFINGVVNADSSSPSSDVTYLRSKLTISSKNRSYTNSYSTYEPTSTFWKRYPDYIGDTYFSSLDSSSDVVTLYYEIDPQVKITNESGDILYLPTGNPAVFYKLDTAFAKESELYTKDDSDILTLYEGTRYIKMLVDSYELTSNISTSDDDDVVLTTATSGDTSFPYTGDSSLTTCTITKSGITSESMLTTSLSQLTIDNVIFDGASESTTAYGAIIKVKNSGNELTITENATIQNGSTTTIGGAVYLPNGATLTMNGGEITKCYAAYGGAVYACGSGTTVNMSGGSITSNTAAAGAAIYVADGGNFNMSGGSITGNTSTGTSGAVAVGGESAVLAFSGDATVTGNTMGSGDSSSTANVYLDQNSNEVIRTASTGLSSDSQIGVYVEGDDSTDPYKSHGTSGLPFGTWVNSDNLAHFTNDRVSGLRGVSKDGDSLIYWELYICKITDSDDSEEHPFKTLNEALTYARTYGNGQAMSSSNAVAIEMLIDYEIPKSDKVTLDQSTDNITITTAATSDVTYNFIPTFTESEGRLSTDSTSTAIVKRASGFTDASLFTVAASNSIKLTTENIIFDGGNIPSIVDNGGGGGAIFVNGTDNNRGSVLTVGNDSTFRNFITNQGGAIYSIGSNMYLNADAEHSIVFKNCSTIYASSGDRLGGAFRTWSGTTVTINNAGTISFDNCVSNCNSSTTGGGGAIWAGRLITGENGNTGVITFNNCSAAHKEGGAIYVGLNLGNLGLSASDATLKLENKDSGTITFNECTAATSGGAIYAKYGKVEVTSSAAGSVTFNNCTATSGSGGGICAANGAASVTNSTFTTCTATSGSGGGVYASGNVTVTNSSTGTIGFTGCTATTKSTSYKGGAIYSGGNVTIENSSTGTIAFDTCTSYMGGGAIFAYAAVTNSVTIENTSTGKVSFETCKSNNGSGGAIATGKFVAENNTGSISFASCTSANNGGAIYTSNSTASVDSFELTNKDGGIVTFTGCTAKSGGAVYVLKGEMTLTGGTTTFTNCKATAGGGGAIWQEDGNSMTIANVTCGALNERGAVVAESACTATGGVAETGKTYGYGGGGGFGENYVKTVSLESCNFYGCKAIGNNNASTPLGRGGGLYLRYEGEGSKVSLTNSTFIGCEAAVHGGGAEIGGKDGATISGCTFKECRAGTGGGNGYGGGLLTMGTVSSVTMNDTTFTGCSGTHGGGWYVDYNSGTNNDGTITMNNVTFGSVDENGNVVDKDACTATSVGGGAIYSKATTNNMNGVKIYGCKATGTGTSAGLGSGVYLATTDATMTLADYDNSETAVPCTITGCTASGTNGGAINVASGCVVKFQGDVQVTGNSNDKNDTDHKHNMVLAYDSNTVIQTTSTGLSENAHIGVYVIDGANYYDKHGTLGLPFGTWNADNGDQNLEGFTNDRDETLFGMNAVDAGKATSTDSNKLIYWGRYICKIVDENSASGSQIGGTAYYEHPFGTLNKALTYARGSAISPAMDSDNNVAIQMLIDYETPSTDAVDLDQASDNITITTANTEDTKNDGENYLFTPTFSSTEGRRTEDVTDSEGNTVVKKDSDEIAILKRGFSGNSLLTISAAAKLTTVKIIFDGANTAYTTGADTYSCSGHGGIIKASDSGSTVTLNTNTILRNSTAAQGGAICAAGTLSVNGADILDCTATGNGGAICLESTAVATEDGLVIVGHTTGGLDSGTNNAVDGGGIYVTSDASFTFSGGEIVDCSVSTNGGGIYNAGAVNMEEKENSTVLTRGVIEYCSAANGGAIYNAAGGTVDMTGGQLVNCTASLYGGGIYTVSAATQTVGGESKGAVNMHTADAQPGVIDNCSAANGGGIYLGTNENKTVTIEIDGGTIQNCYATSNGGAIYDSSQASIKLTGVTINGHTDGGLDSTRKNAKQGGGIFLPQLGQNYTSSLTLNSCNLSNLTAEQGGTIFSNRRSLDASGDGETDNENGCVINITECEINGHTGDFANSIEANAGNGGMLYLGNGAVNIQRANIYNCTVSGDGNAAGNLTAGSGGVIFNVGNGHPNNDGTSPTVTLDTVTIDGHYDEFSSDIANANNGGAVFMKMAKLSMTNCTLKNLIVESGTSGGGKGAAIFGYTNGGGNTPSEITISGGTISDNTAKGTGGGAINVVSGYTVSGGKSSAKVSTVKFEGNAVVFDNKNADGDQANVVLDEDALNSSEGIANQNGVLLTSTTGLGTSAHIGVYVTGTMTDGSEEEPYASHGGYEDDFGMYDAGLIVGGSGSTSVAGDSNLDRFTNDRNGMYGEKCTVSGHTRRIRWQSYLCKLTDSGGYLLYIRSGSETEGYTYTPAVYNTLTAAFEDAGKDNYLYQKTDNTYSDTTYTVTSNINLEMLRNYTQPGSDRPTFSTNRSSLTITTAANATSGVVGKDQGDIYIYNRGSDTTKDDSKATITRGANRTDTGGNDINDASMLTISGAEKKLTLTNIIFDGDKTNYQPAVNGGIVNVSSGTLNIAEGTTLKNSQVSTTTVTAGEGESTTTTTTNGKGGAIYAADGATVYFTGGTDSGISITGNSAADGGAVDVGGSSSRLYFSGNAVIRDNFEPDSSRQPTTQQKNVVLGYDTNNIIRTYGDGIGDSARIGVYVVGEDPSDTIYDKHGKRQKPFGTCAGNSEVDFVDNNVNRFLNDRDNELRGVRNVDGSALIYWEKYICKITDTEGNILYKDNKGENGENWAVYELLGNRYDTQGAFADCVSGKLYNSDGSKYESTTFVVKMLVDYTMPHNQGYNILKTADITLTTAGTGNEPFPYVGSTESTTRGTIYGGDYENRESMFVIGNSNRDDWTTTVTLKDLILDGQATVNVNEGTASGTQCYDHGAIINIRGKNAKLNIKDGAVLRNGLTSKGGGAVCVWGTLNMYGGTIQNCYADGSDGGGAVYIHIDGGAKEFNFYGGTIENCYSKYNGGAIAINGTTLNMTSYEGSTGGTIKNCKAESSGGAVYYYHDNSTFSLSAGRIESCTAGEKGGAIYVYKNRTLEMSGGNITGCSSTKGGAIDVAANNAKLVFSGNAVVKGNLDSNNNEKNVVLNYDSINIIRTGASGLGENASIGVYVVGDDTENNSSFYDKHGKVTKEFGTIDAGSGTVDLSTVDVANLDLFTNDRNGLKGAKGSKIGSSNNYALIWAATGSRKVILRKVNSSYEPQYSGLSFTISGINGTFTPGSSGVFYIGDMAYGTYTITEYEDGKTVGTCSIVIDEDGVKSAKSTDSGRNVTIVTN